LCPTRAPKEWGKGASLGEKEPKKDWVGGNEKKGGQGTQMQPVKNAFRARKKEGQKKLRAGLPPANRPR